MAGNKRKRDNNGKAEKVDGGDDTTDLLEDDGGKTATSSKCKGATTIPIFLKKTYKMIDSCDSKVASWTPEGDMFVVKDPDLFASAVIPQYFDHNKFSSFARQLNFYGFRKMQSKPIRNSDFDANTAKHVTFYNENFKRGRCDLLKKIQRSTRGGGSNPGQDQAKEVQQLRDKVTTLEQTITEMSNQMEERMRRLELDMLGRMEQMMLAMQQQQNANNQNSSNALANRATSGSSNTSSNKGGVGGNNINRNGLQQQQSVGGLGLDPLPFGARGTSIGSISGLMGPLGGPGALSALAKGNSTAGAGSLGGGSGAGSGNGPTLPPHPKMKQLPTTNLPGSVGLPMGRLTSLRGLSNLTRGISGLSRAASVESQSSALLSNPWEDKFFSMLMAGGGNPADRLNQLAAAQSIGGVDFSGGGGTGMNPTPMADAAAQLNAMNMMNAHAAMVSQNSALGNNNNGIGNNNNNSANNAAANTAGV